MARQKVNNSGKADILADVLWIYNNAKQLYDLDGKINPRILDQAPSSGAHVLAMYAKDHFKEFCEKFVIKLLPKDSAQIEAKTTHDSAADLDPDFDTLSQFLQPNKEEGHEAPEMEFESTEGTNGEHRLSKTGQSLGIDEAESSSMANDEMPL